MRCLPSVWPQQTRSLPPRHWPQYPPTLTHCALDVVVVNTSVCVRVVVLRMSVAVELSTTVCVVGVVLDDRPLDILVEVTSGDISQKVVPSDESVGTWSEDVCASGNSAVSVWASNVERRTGRLTVDDVIVTAACVCVSAGVTEATVIVADSMEVASVLDETIVEDPLIVDDEVNVIDSRVLEDELDMVDSLVFDDELVVVDDAIVVVDSLVVDDELVEVTVVTVVEVADVVVNVCVVVDVVAVVIVYVV